MLASETALSVTASFPSSVPLPSRAECISFASQECRTDFDEIHYLEQIKWLHFERNRQGNRVRENIQIDYLQIHFTNDGRCDREHNSTLICIFYLHISYEYIKNFATFFIHRTIIHYLSVANNDTFFSFIHCAFVACHGNTGTENI